VGRDESVIDRSLRAARYASRNTFRASASVVSYEKYSRCKSTINAVSVEYSISICGTNVRRVRMPSPRSTASLSSCASTCSEPVAFSKPTVGSVWTRDLTSSAGALELGDWLARVFAGPWGRTCWVIDSRLLSGLTAVSVGADINSARSPKSTELTRGSAAQLFLFWAP
jgi:hypothetical protein